VFVLLLCTAVRLEAGQDAAVMRARVLAVDGERSEAIALLQESVAASPENSDARTLLGTVLSWEGRYDEARLELDIVLTASPTHGDALPAMINVELWSNHPGRAQELASRGLRNRPKDVGMLLAEARALGALNRVTDASETLDRLLVIDPRNDEAREMRRRLQASLRLWEARVDASYDAFSDRRVAWRESQVSVSRSTPAGSILVRGSRAERFGLTDDQVEIEMYPRFRAGTYAYVAGAYSPHPLLYPQHRYAAELYQSLGAGFEVSAGFRRLAFEPGVTIYTGSLTKYYGNWLFTERLFVTPDSGDTSPSLHSSFRRYFGGRGTYVGLRYGRGHWRDEPRNINDFEVLNSNVVAADAAVILRGHFELSVTGSYSRENRVEQSDLQQYSLSTGLGFRF